MVLAGVVVPLPMIFMPAPPTSLTAETTRLATLLVDGSVIETGPLVLTVVNDPTPGVVPPIAPGAANVAPFKVAAFVAVPVKDAVIVPAEKLPLASRATIVEAVLRLVASVAIVTAAAPL